MPNPRDFGLDTMYPEEMSGPWVVECGSKIYRYEFESDARACYEDLSQMRSDVRMYNEEDTRTVRIWAGPWAIYCPCGGMPNEGREKQPFATKEDAQAELKRMREAWADSASIARIQWNEARVLPYTGDRTEPFPRTPGRVRLLMEEEDDG